MYSTVDDLFKWDQALYSGKLARQSALVEAFSPGKVKQGTSTYGFGWNIVDESGNKYLWHQGNQAGFRAFIGRWLTDRVTIIMLTNKGNSKRLDITPLSRTSSRVNRTFCLSGLVPRNCTKFFTI